MIKKLIITTLLIFSLFVSTVTAFSLEEIAEYVGKTVMVMTLDNYYTPESTIGLACMTFIVEHSESRSKGGKQEAWDDYYLTIVTKDNIVVNIRIADIYDIQLFKERIK